MLSAVFEVSTSLGAGFLGKVYRRALLRELRRRGIQVTAEASFTVTYKGQSVGKYFADLLVGDMPVDSKPIVYTELIAIVDAV